MSFLSKLQAIIAAIEGETLPVDRQMVGMSTPFHIDSSGAVVMAAPSLSVTLDASGEVVAGTDFMPTNYSAIKDVDTTAKSEAVAGYRLLLQPLAANTDPYCLVAFSDSAAAVEAILNGGEGVPVLKGLQLILTVPPSATHFGYVSTTTESESLVTAWQ